MSCRLYTWLGPAGRPSVRPSIDSRVGCSGTWAVVGDAATLAAGERFSAAFLAEGCRNSDGRPGGPQFLRRSEFGQQTLAAVNNCNDRWEARRNRDGQGRAGWKGLLPCWGRGWRAGGKSTPQRRSRPPWARWPRSIDHLSHGDSVGPGLMHAQWHTGSSLPDPGSQCSHHMPEGGLQCL